MRRKNYNKIVGICDGGLYMIRKGILNFFNICVRGIIIKILIYINIKKVSFENGIE